MDTSAQWSALFNAVYGRSVVPADALFVHGWGDLYKETIALTARVFRDAGARLVVLNGESAYDNARDTEGFPYWSAALRKAGIPEDAIRSVVPAKHTLQEAEGFMKIAHEEGIHRAAIVTVPQHLLRAFLTDLGAMRKKGMDIALSPYTLANIDWDAPIEVRGLSGGPLEHTTRLGRLVSECARIMEYRKRMEKGGPFTIASVSEALEYLGIHSIV